MLEVGNRVRLSAPDRGVVDATAHVDAIYLPDPRRRHTDITQVAILSYLGPLGMQTITVILINGEWWNLAHEPVSILPFR
jgi:hypothetical protein